MIQPERIRILFVEDTRTDVELELRELTRAGLAVEHRVVERKEDFIRELAAFRPDIILSDFSMPSFDGMTALAIARETATDIPFIFVAGTLGEDHAIRALKEGATDYVLKTNLLRLPSAVERALVQARALAAKREIERGLRESELKYRSLVDAMSEGLGVQDKHGTITFMNKRACEMLGYEPQELIGKPAASLFDEENRKILRQQMAGRPQGGRQSFEIAWLRKDGGTMETIVAPSPRFDEKGEFVESVAVFTDITERKRAEHELQRFRMAMDVSPDSIYLTDPATMRFVYLNDTACQRLGYSRDRLLQMDVHEVLPVGRELLSRGYGDVIAAGDRGLVQESPFAQSDGTKGWAEIHSRALRTEAGTLIVTIGRNITERRRADEQIRRLNRVYAVLSGINALIVRVRDRDELFREACRIAVEAGEFGIAWIGALDRKTLRLRPVAWQGIGGEHAPTLDIGVGEDAPERDTLAAQAIRDGRAVISNDVKGDPRILLKEQMLAAGLRSVIVLPLLVSGVAVGTLTLVAAGAGFFDEEEVKLLTELAGDIAFALDHIEKEETVSYLALHDSLTGLANRSLFHERLSQFLGTAALEKRKLAVLVFDLERFRAVNETLGRQAGDDLLRQIAERARRFVTDPNWLARIGPDQFASAIPEVASSDAVVRRIEQRVLEILGRPFKLGEAEVRVSVKIGIAIFPDDGADADALLRNAEAALRKAKASGDRYLFYTQEMTARVAENLALENKLRQALEKEEFVLHYQPKVDTETRRILGVEALIRWQSPELGLVPPMKFIPLMEETGMILEAGAWALRRAAADHRNWVEQRIQAPRVAVNVSAIQLQQQGFVRAVEQAIIEGVAPTGIDLEITESLIMEDIEGNVRKLKEVHGLGVRIAIDDFGTGYSSLGYLAKLPVQTLKIDRSFIITMLKDPDTMTLVQTIISLAHSLRLKVVAEGVDEEDQAKTLRLLRCDEMQGYLFSKPMPFAEMTALLRQGYLMR